MLACVLAAAWARSFKVCDFIHWNWSCWSVNGNLCLIPSPESSTMSWEWPQWSGEDFAAAEAEAALEGITWKWRIMGFGDGEVTIVGTKFRIFLFAYWSLVIPLVLLAAWLLHRKPEK